MKSKSNSKSNSETVSRIKPTTASWCRYPLSFALFHYVPYCDRIVSQLGAATINRTLSSMGTCGLRVSLERFLNYEPHGNPRYVVGLMAHYSVPNPHTVFSHTMRKFELEEVCGIASVFGVSFLLMFAPAITK